MKVVAFNGSPRKKGNTAMLINTVFEVLQKENIETEFIQLGGKDIRGCIACMKCFETQDNKCVSRKDDILNDYFQEMLDADGMIIGSPTYFANVSSEVKALIDRAGLISIVNGHSLQRKVGAGVVAVRRAGSTDAFDAISRAYAYTFHRPLHYLFYLSVAALLGCFGWLLVWGTSESVVHLGYWGTGWGAGGCMGGTV